MQKRLKCKCQARKMHLEHAFAASISAPALPSMPDGMGESIADKCLPQQHASARRNLHRHGRPRLSWQPRRRQVGLFTGQAGTPRLRASARPWMLGKTSTRRGRQCLRASEAPKARDMVGCPCWQRTMNRVPRTSARVVAGREQHCQGAHQEP